MVTYTNSIINDLEDFSTEKKGSWKLGDEQKPVCDSSNMQHKNDMIFSEWGRF